MNEIEEKTTTNKTNTKQTRLQEVQFSARLQHGLNIAKQTDQIMAFTNTRYVVKSQNSNNEYDVLLTRIGWICSCRDHTFRGVICKHIYAVWFRQNTDIENVLELAFEKSFLETNFS